MVYVTPCASLYSDAANCLSGDVRTKLVGVKTSPSHKVLSRELNVMRLMRIFSKNSSSLFLVIELAPLLLPDVLVSSESTKLPLLEQRHWWWLDYFLLPWNELLRPTNFRGRKPTFSFFVAMSKKRNHPCVSLMHRHIMFNMEIQCNVFFPHVLSTRRQFQRLEYSICPSVYNDDLMSTRRNQLIIATCCLYCWTNPLR